MTIVSIKEGYPIVDTGGAAYIGELGHGFKPHVSISIARWFVMDFPVQWDVLMETLGVLLGLVNKDGRHEAFPIRLGKYK